MNLTPGRYIIFFLSRVENTLYNEITHPSTQEYNMRKHLNKFVALVIASAIVAGATAVFRKFHTTEA